MPNPDPWINQNKATNKFENHLLSIKASIFIKTNFNMILIMLN
jgi:hypothetical protein